MNKFLLALPVLMFTFAACDRPHEPRPPAPPTSPTAFGDTEATDAATIRRNGNGSLNANGSQATPLDQSQAAEDLAITQRIRQALIENRNLSTDAKNIKVITLRNARVVLRGAVPTAEERSAIEARVKQVQGVQSVDNQIEVKANHR